MSLNIKRKSSFRRRPNNSIFAERITGHLYYTKYSFIFKQKKDFFIFYCIQPFLVVRYCKRKLVQEDGIYEDHRCRYRRNRYKNCPF